LVGFHAGQSRPHRCRRRQQQGQGKDDQREAEIAQNVVRDGGCLAALGVVEQQRDVGERLGDRFDLVDRLWRLDEQRVRAGLAVRPRPRQRAVQTLDRARVRASDDQEVGRAPGGHRSRQLGNHLGRGKHLLALHMAALLGHDLVLEVDRRHAGRLVLAHGADHVDRVAVAGIGVRHHGNIHGLDDPPGVVDHLGHRHQSHVWPSQE
jgi:hypothetical protein